jgi:aryl-alcohol dehydrogenase
MDITAAVIRTQGGPFSIESLSIAEPREDEVLVELFATGICHTDQEAVLGHLPPNAPAIFGHEGAGIAIKVGTAVRNVSVGDHVVLSYPHCGHCAHCTSGDPVRCPDVIPLAISGVRTDGSPTVEDASGAPINAVFFGQSSFASHALARWPGVVPIRKDAPLELMGPLGCGIQTGAGTVLNTLRPSEGDSIAVFGCGAVGLAAVMAAKVSGCSRIVALDRASSRLELARELGATDVVDVSDLTLEAIKEAVGEVRFSVEASGSRQASEAAVAVLAPHGRCALLGVSKPGTTITLNHEHLLNCRSVVGVMQGDSDPQTFIPRLVELFMAGQLPVDRLVQFFPLDAIEQAFAASASGEVVKPVLRMPGHE